LGVAALIIVLSVMNGFQTQVRDRMLSVLPHIELSIPHMAPLQVVSEWEALAAKASELPVVQGAAPYVAAQGMVVRGERLSGVQLRGIDPAQEAAVSEIGAQMLQGKLDSLTDGSYNIILGNQLAASLGVRVGDTVLVLAPQGSLSPAGFTPRMRQFT